MSPWRVEMLRVWRTRRLVALVAVFVLFGLGIPVLTYYLPEIVRHANTGGVQIILPRQTPADALIGFGQNAAQLGTLVVVVVAAASLAIDARPLRRLLPHEGTTGLALAPAPLRRGRRCRRLLPSGSGSSPPGSAERGGGPQRQRRGPAEAVTVWWHAVAALMFRGSRALEFSVVLGWGRDGVEPRV